MDKTEKGPQTAMARARQTAWMLGVAVAMEVSKGQPAQPEMAPAIQMWGDFQRGDA